MCRLERRLPAQELQLGVDAMAVGEGGGRLEASDVEAQQEAHEDRHPRHDRTGNDREVEDRPLERPSLTDRRGTGATGAGAADLDQMLIVAVPAG